MIGFSVTVAIAISIVLAVENCISVPSSMLQYFRWIHREVEIGIHFVNVSPKAITQSMVNSTGRDRLPSDSMGGRWQTHSGRSTFVGRSSMAFGLRCIPRHSFLNRFAEVASMPWVDASCSPRNQHSGLVLSCCARRPWGVGRGKGTPNSVVEKRLHAHKK